MEDTKLTAGRNLVISTKVTVLEKMTLQRLADEYKKSLSEFFYILVLWYADKFNEIGKESSKEIRLTELLRLSEKREDQLKNQLDNADCRVGMERATAEKAMNERDEFRYEVKELKKEKKKLKEAHLDDVKEIKRDYEEQIKKLRKSLFL